MQTTQYDVPTSRRPDVSRHPFLPAENGPSWHNARGTHKQSKRDNAMNRHISISTPEGNLIPFFMSLDVPYTDCATPASVDLFINLKYKIKPLSSLLHLHKN